MHDVKKSNVFNMLLPQSFEGKILERIRNEQIFVSSFNKVVEMFYR